MQTQDRPQAKWQGSLKTCQLIKQQIAERWGDEEAEKYDPDVNCFTFNAWRAKGYHVKKGEKALRSFTLVDKPATDEQEAARYPKGVALFYYLQVEPMKK